MLNPFAPHMTEEIYQRIGNDKTIAQTPWPKYDEDKTVEDMIELPIQINGKLRSTIKVELDTPEEKVKELVHNDDHIKKFIADKTIVKEIFVKNKIYNIVVK